MATPEQVASILSQLVALHPADCFKPIDAANAGLGAVLRLLYLADQPVTAGTISEKLHVSTARVAVLLKKLGSIVWRLTALSMAEYWLKISLYSGWSALIYSVTLFLPWALASTWLNWLSRSPTTVSQTRSWVAIYPAILLASSGSPLIHEVLALPCQP